MKVKIALGLVSFVMSLHATMSGMMPRITRVLAIAAMRHPAKTGRCAALQRLFSQSKPPLEDQQIKRQQEITEDFQRALSQTVRDVDCRKGTATLVVGVLVTPDGISSCLKARWMHDMARKPDSPADHLAKDLKETAAHMEFSNMTHEEQMAWLRNKFESASD